MDKHRSAAELVEAIETAAGGREVHPQGQKENVAAGSWPGRREGLTERESGVPALLVQGLSNDDIARCTSPSTVTTYLRRAFHTIDVQSRTQALLWGIKHGFAPDHQHLTTSLGPSTTGDRRQPALRSAAPGGRA